VEYHQSAAAQGQGLTNLSIFVVVPSSIPATDSQLIVMSCRLTVTT
jgi:hypothetical protein